MKRYFLLISLMLFSFSSLSSDLDTKTYNFNIKDTDLKVVLEMVASHGGLKVEIPADVSGSVSYGFNKVTLKSALDRITRDNGLNYIIKNNTVYVSLKDPGTSGSGVGGSSSIHRILVRYTGVSDLKERIPSVLLPGESLTPDEANNAFVFSGSEQTLRKIKGLVSAFDHEPRQILIEAQIVELSKTFSRDIGFTYGDLSSKTTPLGKPGYSSGIIDTKLPDEPNILGRYVMGLANGVNLEAFIAAAESRGDAKVISKPKIVTLNNMPARINSGIQFYVKTLSTLTTGAGEEEEAVSSGVETISAGFELLVNPTIIGSDRVRLSITVSNSEPSDGLAIDGIPGVIDNSANTSIIVQDGQTATIAGLLKTNKGNSSSGVPFLSRIPILGLFFKSHTDRNRTTELVIFVTPRLINNVSDLGSVSFDDSVKE